MRNLVFVLNIIIVAKIAVAADNNKDVSIVEKNSVRAARSVHLAYQAPDAVMFYNEVTVEKSQKGSFFMACGFNYGYFGIQERWNDKVVIFSVWDPGKQNNPNEVEEDRRVKLLYKDDDVTIGRFGNEGTGGQSFLKYKWKLLEKYKFMIKAKVNGDRTEYTAFFYINEKKQWKHLVTFSTITNGDYLKGYYSFIEDFRRDVKSASEIRKASFNNGWVKTTKGHWISLTKAKFTADPTPTLNINAGTTESGFFLQTGGDTKNETQLWLSMERSPKGLVVPEESTPKAKLNQ